jgi:multiple sugar transport system permease protein/raffinose/stachyose/melibiose transport system permease protein
VIVFSIVPIIGALVIAFLDYNPLRSSNTFVGLANFYRLLEDKVFIKSLTNTLIFVFFAVIINLILSLLMSQAIAKLKSNKSRSLFRVIFFMPCVAPLVASAIVWGGGILATKRGLVNPYLDTSIGWLSDPKFVLLSMIVFTLWADIGYNIILFSAGIDGIPGEFYEAAALDGASEWQKFTKITLPLLSRTFAFVSAMTVISYFQMFAQFQVMLIKGEGPELSGSVLTHYIYKVGFEHKELGYASAISLVLFVIIMAVTMIQNRFNRSEWEY